MNEFHEFGGYVDNVANMFNSKPNNQFSFFPTFDKRLPLVANLDWVGSHVYFDKNSVLTPSDLTPIVCGLNKLLAAKYFGDVDQIFNWVEMSRIHTGILICFLRVTGQFRKNIHTWHAFKKKIEMELTDRGEDMSRKLRGLPDV